VDPYRQLTEALTGLVALPFVLASGLLRLAGRLLWLWQRWRAVPLQTKNQVRSGAGAGGLTLCALSYSQLLALPHRTTILAGAAALSLLYLVAGALGARGTRFDWFSAFWYAAAGLAAGTFLIFGKIPGLSWAWLN
jgi:hypothetical protein